MTDTPLIAAARPLAPGLHFTQTEVDHLAAVEASFAKRAQRAPLVLPPAAVVIDHDNPLTLNAALELASYEALVQEAYLDSGNVWTWSIGVTDASGHTVGRYKDNPQTVQQCLSVYIWLLRKNYIPDVLKAFGGHPLTEAQFAAALSFHYNTGAILSSSWVSDYLSGNATGSRRFLESHYLNNGILANRRKGEAALFFDGTWSNNGRISVFPVAKPSYHPDFRHGQRVDIRDDLKAALAG